MTFAKEAHDLDKAFFRRLGIDVSCCPPVRLIVAISGCPCAPFAAESFTLVDHRCWHPFTVKSAYYMRTGCYVKQRLGRQLICSSTSHDSFCILHGASFLASVDHIISHYKPAASRRTCGHLYKSRAFCLILNTQNIRVFARQPPRKAWMMQLIAYHPKLEALRALGLTP